MTGSVFARKFVPGLQMGELYFEEIVRPALASHFPRLRYGAALIGPGSEVLGLDDEISTDHDWRPRVFVFLTESDHHSIGDAVAACLEHARPETFRGFPTGLDDVKGDVRSGTVYTVDHFWMRCVGVSSHAELDARTWLTLRQHHLLILTSGAVYHDDTGELTDARTRFAWYPDDVWRYMLAAQWMKLSQESVHLSRCGNVGDELGSRIVAARMTREVMALGFLMEQKYVPYSKWFGTMFRQLHCAPHLSPLIQDVLDQDSWQKREHSFGLLAQATANAFNDLQIVEPISSELANFYSRSYKVLNADRYASALMNAIQSTEIKALPSYVGAVDQFIDSIDIISHADRCARLKALY